MGRGELNSALIKLVSKIGYELLDLSSVYCIRLVSSIAPHFGRRYITRGQLNLDCILIDDYILRTELQHKSKVTRDSTKKTFQFRVERFLQLDHDLSLRLGFPIRLRSIATDERAPQGSRGPGDAHQGVWPEKPREI